MSSLHRSRTMLSSSSGLSCQTPLASPVFVSGQINATVVTDSPPPPLGALFLSRHGGPDCRRGQSQRPQRRHRDTGRTPSPAPVSTPRATAEAVNVKLRVRPAYTLRPLEQPRALRFQWRTQGRVARA
ncbi:hypothetical protein L227DRAFT_240575 [Lentinus tigrinus ALCF2SS1-6]|uniref:Uncharacterized protein n=1 Tax=Lentinus tigrinus ALCF2SS1-6 TaxID=1328759 RepID=A0A5C2S0G5_9APHY|nr:hypothetical protein L227DRAFT_240575 [Lentinus tigrinus ALCF2SS1-6]